MPDSLSNLTVAGCERREYRTCDEHASFCTTDGFCVGVRATPDDDTYAYEFKTFTGEPYAISSECVVTGHLSASLDPELADVAEMVQNQVIAARIEQGCEPTEAQEFPT